MTLIVACILLTAAVAALSLTTSLQPGMLPGAGGPPRRDRHFLARRWRRTVV